MTRLSIVFGLLSALAILFVIWVARQVFLALFAGILLAVFLHRLARLLRRLLPLPQQLAVVTVIILLVLLLAAAGTLFTTTFIDQFGGLFQRIPDAWQRITEFTRDAGILDQNVSELRQFGQSVISGTAPVLSRAGSVFSGISSLAVLLFVTLLVGVYGAFEPGYYREGILRLVPVRHRGRAELILNQLSDVLWWWLLGRALAMLAIGIMTTLALLAFGVPLALVLGLLAGLLAVIPYIGPFLSAVPAVLVAATESLGMVLIVLAVFAAVQFIEGNILTPLIERRTIRLPPVVTIGSQLLLAALSGPLGVMLASPLVAAAAVLTKRLYIDRLES